ncbi:MAG: hypothetical protein HZB13_02550 [Acidobacteria bacterium]|nr:hypothetical protein [Acidobacteriota bacterium]
MPVFDGANKTPTRISLSGDSFTPAMGALGRGSQKEEALIHGTQKEVIEKFQISYVTMNRTFRTGINFNCTVGAQRRLIETNYLQLTNAIYRITVAGPTIDTRGGATLHTFISPLVENHGSPRSTAEPASSMNVITSFLATFIDSKNIAMNSSEAYANKFALSGLNNDHKLIANGIVGFENKLAGFCLTTEVFENKTTAIFNRVNPLEPKIEALEAELKALKASTTTELAAIKLAANSYAM